MNSTVDTPDVQESSADCHLDFLPLYPVIQRHAKVVFHHLNAVEREEAVAETVAAGFTSFVRLKNRGKDPSTFPTALAKFAALHVKNGRHVGSESCQRDVFSRTAQERHRFTMQSVSSPGQGWGDFLVDDSVTPILDQISFRLDWAVFLASFSWRHRQIIHALAMGYPAKWVANKFDLSPPRITQLRKQWRREWLAFIGETGDGHADPSSDLEEVV